MARIAMSTTVKRAARIDNAAGAHAAKVMVRRRIVEALGTEIRVFDAYAGEGAMFGSIWKNATAYVGCDLRFFRDRRICFVGDNRRVLRAIDLSAFNVIDLDSYGSPWEQALIVAARRRLAPGERLGVAITDGSTMKLKLGGMPNAMKLIAGVAGNPAGLARESDAILNAAISGFARRLNAEVERQWRAVGKTGAAMRYIGLVLRGREFAPETPVEEGAPLSVFDRITDGGLAWTEPLTPPDSTP